MATTHSGNTQSVVNHIQEALTKISGGALENEMVIILYSLTEECSVPAVSRMFSGVEEHPGDIGRVWCVPIWPPYFTAIWEFTLLNEPTHFL